MASMINLKKNVHVIEPPTFLIQFIFMFFILLNRWFRRSSKVLAIRRIRESRNPNSIQLYDSENTVYDFAERGESHKEALSLT